MATYTVEIDGKRYKIAGDRPPNEAEARAAVSAYTGAAHTDGTHATPEQQGALSRFMEPIGQAAKAALGLPAAAVRGLGTLNYATEQASQGNAGPMADIGSGVVHAVVDPSREQFRKADEAGAAGNYVEGVGHVAAGLLPVVGPAAADAGETMASDNVAGGLGQAAVALAPFAPAPKFAEGVAQLMKRRAAARMFAVMRPEMKFAQTAREIAPEVASGVAGRESMGGLGVGTRDTLAKRAEARAKMAGSDIEALQTLPQRINPAPISKSLRDEALKKETRAPSGQVFTEDPGLVDALRAHADKVDEITKAFGGDVPAGELFKQRAVLGKRLGNKAAGVLPGDLTSAQVEAGTVRNAQTSKLLHDEIPSSQVPDHEYHIMRNAEINLKRSGLRDLVGRDGNKVMNLLAGRLFGSVAGAATGYAAGGGHVGGLLGAVGGMMLGESAYWGSLRATTYKNIANLLRAGDIDGAANIIQRSASVYAADKAIKERERNHRAQKALRAQAEGVVGP